MEAQTPFAVEYAHLVDCYRLSAQEQQRILEAVFLRMEQPEQKKAGETP